jgi:hypothetical protein
MYDFLSNLILKDAEMFLFQPRYIAIERVCDRNLDEDSFDANTKQRLFRRLPGLLTGSFQCQEDRG